MIHTNLVKNVCFLVVYHNRYRHTLTRHLPLRQYRDWLLFSPHWILDEIANSRLGKIREWSVEFHTNVLADDKTQNTRAEAIS